MFFFYLSVFPVEVACVLHFTKKGDWAFINRLFELLAYCTAFPMVMVSQPMTGILLNPKISLLSPARQVQAAFQSPDW